MGALQRIGDAGRAANPLLWIRDRIWLSLAKHRSLAGHPRTALRLSRLLPVWSHDESDAFGLDEAPGPVVAARRAAFFRVSDQLTRRAPRTLAASATLAEGVSDAAFVDAYRVPFPFRRLAQRYLPVGTVVAAAVGCRLWDLDGNESWDLTGAYGVNLFGTDFYKGCIERGAARAAELGLVLGPYHPVVADNVRRLKEISGKDEVSFHMSGTEAVMQAVRLARYHTGRRYVVRFTGAYHGWWDGVQAGPGNPLPARDVFTLEEQSERALRVIRTRRDIACVLVNPLQALSPNGTPAADNSLVTGRSSGGFDREAYVRWLRALRQACTERGIALILDEVFLGFRVARGGVQEWLGVEADLVTYGKTLGGGLPVGVLCGGARWMKRFRDDHPADICFARGTFNSHPYVMATMDEFLRHLDRPEVRAAYEGQDARWDARAADWNARLVAAGVPVRVSNLVSVWSVGFTQPSRYHWMLQYYLRLQGLTLAWTGTGRLIFPHSITEEELEAVTRAFVAGCRAMAEDGWWWRSEETSERTLRRRVLRDTLRALTGAPAPRPPPAIEADSPPAIAARAS